MKIEYKNIQPHKSGCIFMWQEFGESLARLGCQGLPDKFDNNIAIKNIQYFVFKKH